MISITDSCVVLYSAVNRITPRYEEVKNGEIIFIIMDIEAFIEA